MHCCLGASLARLEIRVMVEEIARRLPDVDLAEGARPRKLPSAFACGDESVPMTFTPA